MNSPPEISNNASPLNHNHPANTAPYVANHMHLVSAWKANLLWRTFVYLDLLLRRGAATMAQHPTNSPP